MRRKLFGILGGAIALAGAVGGAFTAERKRREARFFRDLMADLQVAAGYFRGRRDSAMHESVTPAAAVSLTAQHEEFSLVRDGMMAEVDAGLPDNQDPTRMTVVIHGTEHTLFTLRRQLVAGKGSGLSVEDVGTITHAPGGATITFTLLLPGLTEEQAAALQHKLTTAWG